MLGSPDLQANLKTQREQASNKEDFSGGVGARGSMNQAEPLL